MQRVYLIAWYKHNYFNTMLFFKINKLLVFADDHATSHQNWPTSIITARYIIFQ